MKHIDKPPLTSWKKTAELVGEVMLGLAGSLFFVLLLNGMNGHILWMALGLATIALTLIRWAHR